MSWMLRRDRSLYHLLMQKIYLVASLFAYYLDNLVNNLNLGCSQFSSQRKYVISESMLSSGSFGHIWMARNVADHSLSVLKRIRIVVFGPVLNPIGKRNWKPLFCTSRDFHGNSFSRNSGNRSVHLLVLDLFPDTRSAFFKKWGWSWTEVQPSPIESSPFRGSFSRMKAFRFRRWSTRPLLPKRPAMRKIRWCRLLLANELRTGFGEKRTKRRPPSSKREPNRNCRVCRIFGAPQMRRRRWA